MSNDVGFETACAVSGFVGILIETLYMRQVIALFGLAGAVTVLSIELKLIYALQVTLREAATGNVDALGQFILVAIVALLAIQLLALMNPFR